MPGPGEAAAMNSAEAKTTRPAGSIGGSNQAGNSGSIRLNTTRKRSARRENVDTIIAPSPSPRISG
jgi:hypothetical protein